jgi:hypothetical protein
MAHKQSYEISLPDVATPSMAVSTKSLVDKESKKQFSIGEFLMRYMDLI